MYYWIMTRSTLGERLSYSERERAITFVLACQGLWGGFARSRMMGIQTLEYTYYALSILDRLDALPKQNESRYRGAGDE